MVVIIERTHYTRVRYEGAKLHLSCKRWSYYSWRRTKQGERSKRGSTVSQLHLLLVILKTQSRITKPLVFWKWLSLCSTRRARHEKYAEQRTIVRMLLPYVMILSIAFMKCIWSNLLHKQWFLRLAMTYDDTHYYSSYKTWITQSIWILEWQKRKKP